MKQNPSSGSDPRKETTRDAGTPKLDHDYVHYLTGFRCGGEFASYASTAARKHMGPGPGEHMPKSCGNCGAVGTLEFLEEPDLEHMSDGQLADYEARLWRTVIC